MISNRTPLICMAFLAVAVFAAADLSAQDSSDRFGEWKMDSDRPAPYSNIMTYEAWGDGGMSITVTTTNAQGEESAWGYNTLFDGAFRAVWGQENAETSVEFVDEHTTRIKNMRNGRVSQVIINTLSEDGNTIDNEYVRLDEDGEIMGVGHATYLRIR